MTREPDLEQFWLQAAERFDKQARIKKRSFALRLSSAIALNTVPRCRGRGHDRRSTSSNLISLSVNPFPGFRTSGRPMGKFRPARLSCRSGRVAMRHVYRYAWLEEPG